MSKGNSVIVYGKYGHELNYIESIADNIVFLKNPVCLARDYYVKDVSVDYCFTMDGEPLYPSEYQDDIPKPSKETIESLLKSI